MLTAPGRQTRKQNKAEGGKGVRNTSFLAEFSELPEGKICPIGIFHLEKKNKKKWEGEREE